MIKVFLLALLLMGTLTHATEIKSEGMIYTLEQLLLAQKEQNKRLTGIIKSNRSLPKTLVGSKNVRLDHLFMRNILLYSDPKYLDLIGKNECMFYSMLETNILRTAEGPITNVLVTFQNNFKKWQTTIISKKDFLSAIYKNKCQSNVEYRKKFSRRRIVKSVMELNFQVPKSESECSEILSHWQKNPYTPYLCNIPETIRWGKKIELMLKENKTSSAQKSRFKNIVKIKNQLQTGLKFSKRTYLNNLCNNIQSEKSFCSLYLHDDIWGKVIKEDAPAYLMKYNCNRYYKNNDDPLTMLGSCRRKMSSSPEICSYSIDKELSSLYPRSRCDLGSSALNASHLITNYQDCPGKMDSEAITNTYRILRHFYKIDDSPLDKGCDEKPLFSFAQLNLDFAYKQAWPLEICFDDRISEKKTCIAYAPGKLEGSKLSEPVVVASILKKLVSAPPNLKCKLVPQNKFSSKLLEFKIGCHIIFDEKHCTSLNCPKEIRYNNRVVKGIEYRGMPVFDYFDNSYSRGKYSIAAILEEVKKIKPTILKNLTEINYYLGLGKDAIIHGVGCVENILPSFFEKRSINQCTPMPFILDGAIKDGKNTMLVLRAPIDDVHHPRLINWKDIFTAVSSYRNIHPNKQWALYGIKK